MNRLNLSIADLRSFVICAHSASLSQAARRIPVSQPTLTRTMQKVQDAFGVPLFVKPSHRFELNEAGRRALMWAERISRDAEAALQDVRRFSREANTFSVASCAPAPLWVLLPKLAPVLGSAAVSTEIDEEAQIWSRLQEGALQMGILLEGETPPGFVSQDFFTEKLFVMVPAGHELASRPSTTFAEMNGFNFLLRPNIGFWDGLCRRRMPASRFLVQTDDVVASQLEKTTQLLSFATDISLARHPANGRTAIAVTDPEATARFRMVFSEENTLLQAWAKKQQ